MRKNHRTTMIGILMALIAGMLVFCGAGKNDAPSPEYTEFSELSGKRVSMLTGAPFEELVKSKVPDVAEFSYFNNTPDMMLALGAGKTDAALSNNAVGTLAVNRSPGLALFPQNLDDGVFGFAFAKGDARRDAWQEAYETIPEEVKQQLWEKWTGADESAKTLPAQDWPGNGGTVKAAVCDTLEPMSYLGKSGELMGFDIEMILTMAKEMDVHVEFTGMEFSAVMASVQAGKAEIGAGSIIATDERKESVDFVEYYPAAFVLVVRSAQADMTASSSNAPDASAPQAEDYAEKRIAVMTGSNFPDIVTAKFPKAEQVFLNTVADMLTAMQADKVDAIALDEPAARSLAAENGDVAVAKGYLDQFDYAYTLTKTEEGSALCEELSAFIREYKENGKLEELQVKWFDQVPEESMMEIDPSSLTGQKGTLRVATIQYPPLTMQGENMFFGYEIELLVLFGDACGYKLEFTDMNADAVIPAVQSGKYDLSASGSALTEERKEMVLFSEPNYSGGVVLAVRNEEANDKTSFFHRIKESFQKTFIRENRYKLFLQGIGMTVLITVLSTLFGTILGFLLFMACRRGNPFANRFAAIYSWLMAGMPMVVLLMILYYIVFEKVPISGAAVSVIGFTLVFCANVFGWMTTAVGTVDGGQLEAAYALGYTDRKAFFRCILPQAMPHFMPGYRGGLVSLIKATSIVGYVAVQDLTKMGDIVRSRTYEAFFPLIAVAIIYFVLAGILVFLVDRVALHFDPTRRKTEEILNGIHTERP